MKMVTTALRFTPFGVLALMIKFVSTSNFSEILRLVPFVLASYLAIIIMFIIHFIIILVFGLNPFTFIKKAAPALTVLSAMELPVSLVGLLIAIEPLIDMGRTALNVSDSMLSGVVSAKLMKELDAEVYNNKNYIE